LEIRMGSAILDHPFRTHFAHLVRWLQCIGDAPISLKRGQDHRYTALL